MEILAELYMGLIPITTGVSISMEHNFHFKTCETNGIEARINDFSSFLTLRLLPFPPALHDEEWKQRTRVMTFSAITDDHSWSTRVY